MIRGIGVDVVKIGRIKRILDSSSISQRFLQKVLSSEEIELCQKLVPDRRPPYVAGRWASKEALVKCLCDRAIHFPSVTISSCPKGSPQVSFEKETREKLCLENSSIFLSITHEDDILVAVAIAQFKL